ncbi:hypothetical protein [Malikia sp.]|uniref:hypothetical protein n=1 Tax=Malikia sp. TaxID=2070706 RepID=UPI0026307E8F|nr:hypothetical protein [Malikia sp.]MDD2727946.1 hypothetical protein [Malikia sp.]
MIGKLMAKAQKDRLLLRPPKSSRSRISLRKKNKTATSKKKYGYQLIRCIRCDQFFSNILQHKCSFPASQILKKSNQLRSTVPPDKKQRESHPPESAPVTTPEQIRYAIRRIAPSFIEINLKQCPFCNDPPIVRLQRHIKSYHPEKMDELSKMQADKPHVCKVCNEAFNKRRQAIDHLCTIHNDYLFHAAFKSESASGSKSIVQRPGKKSEPIRSGKFISNDPIKIKRPASKKIFRGEDDGSIESAMLATMRGLYDNGVLREISGNEQTMDAKRHWGGSFRDGSQFGSYSSHDDYDEEGSP